MCVGGRGGVGGEHCLVFCVSSDQENNTTQKTDRHDKRRKDKGHDEDRVKSKDIERQREGPMQPPHTSKIGLGLGPCCPIGLGLGLELGLGLGLGS